MTDIAPVCALPQMSRPSSASGTHAACIQLDRLSERGCTNSDTSNALGTALDHTCTCMTWIGVGVV
jgi:hypothetical protein